jgi:hypothetical protein
MRLFCCEVAANFAAKGGFAIVRQNRGAAPRVGIVPYSFVTRFSTVADFVAGKHAVKVAP